jgi:hypothetical protein
MKTTKQSTGNQKRRGIALIWVAIVSLVLFAFAGLLIDLARIYITAQKLSNTADAAALAGSRYVAIGTDPDYTGVTAEQVAQTYADKHTAANVPVYLDPGRYVSDDTVISSVDPDEVSPYDAALVDDIVIGRYLDWNQTFIVDHLTPDSMLVIARREGDPSQPELPLLFGPVFGINLVDVKRYAIAKVRNPYGAGLLALGECDCPGIYFGGSGAADDLTVYGGGSLYVNASYNPGGTSGAIDQTGNAPSEVNVDRIYVVGGIDANFNYPDDAEIVQNPDVEPESDPYEYLPDHNIDQIRAMVDMGMISDSDEPMTYSPGYYSGGIQINNSMVILEPGDYFLDSIGQDASMSVNGGTITDDGVLGRGVTLHIIGDADMGIDMQGNGNILIEAPDDSSTYDGVAIYQKRDPDYNCAKSCVDWPNSYPLSELLGSGDIILDGAVYMPHNKLRMGGTGYIYLSRVVADRFHIYGNGEKIVNYKGIPEIAPKSYLVE